jgi:uncharacterized protein YcnI
MTHRIDYKRAVLAALTAVTVALALVLVAGGSPASADAPNSLPWTSETNEPGYWEVYGNDAPHNEDDWVCTKEENKPEVPGAYVIGDPPDGSVWRLLVVKAGSTVNDLNWNPLSGQSFSHSQQGGWSHVILCSRPITTPESGKIIVKKEVTAGSDTSKVFAFTESGFTLDDNTLADGEMGMSGDVDAGGDYSVSESVPAGWTLKSKTCDDTNSTPDDINVEEGETVTCTFVNHEIPDEINPGKIIVKKEVTAGSDTAQSFVFTPSGFTLDDNTLADGEMGMSDDVEPGGDYSVSESVPAGWTLQLATCDDANSTPADINVEEGETVTCTFVNHIPDEVSPTSIVSTTTTILSTTTTIVSTTVEVSDETLPFTGFENGTTGLLALILVASGALALVGARVFREETDE